VPEEETSKLKHFVKHNLLFVVVMSMFAVLAAILIISKVVDEVNNEERQELLEPFYTPSDPLPSATPGLLLKQEDMHIDIPGGGQGVRILYLSELPDGTTTIASGMVFYPPGTAPAEGRRVVAWAHPTVGLASKCAPSRTDNPISDMTWLGEMMSRGWVVTATDYSGLGTEGAEHYLVGTIEARDVINSVRAAQQVKAAGAGSLYAVWGHSQGGHAALFTALLSGDYAPELQLAATAVAAPAAELTTLFSEQYKSEAGWVIGPEVLVSWPGSYPDLDIDDVITSKGLERFEELAADCLIRAGEEAAGRNMLKEDFFKENPMTVSSWYDAALKETPIPVSPEKPLLVIQGLDDKVVLPDTTALFVQKSCQAESNITTIWLGGTNHMKAAEVGGSAAIFWLNDRFNGKPTSPSCDQVMPVNAANEPTPPGS
jgi:pimeloyl-ACP methyl ester carboxylesterase